MSEFYRSLPTARNPKPDVESEESLVGAVSPFNPTERNVEQVLAYADANPDEVQRLVDEEYAGRARSGILSALTK